MPFREKLRCCWNCENRIGCDQDSLPRGSRDTGQAVELVTPLVNGGTEFLPEDLLVCRLRSALAVSKTRTRSRRFERSFLERRDS